MRWHPDLSLEIAAEFRALDGRVPWDRIEDWYHIAKLYKKRHWANYSKWWRKTTAGKRCARDGMRRKRVRLRAMIIGVGKCIVCGRAYERRAIDRKEKRTCSRSCRTTEFSGNAHFVVIDGVRKSLAAWARHYGLKQPTLHYRLKRGMNIREALTAPLMKSGPGRGGALARTEEI